MDVTQRRINRNEAILRDHAMHEPTRTGQVAEKAKSATPPKKAPVCNCWLSRPVVA